jgi:hypothetical protein
VTNKTLSAQQSESGQLKTGRLKSSQASGTHSSIERSNIAALDRSVKGAIESTERYYREQIFSSGCSSIVPIHRIGGHIKTPNELLKQLQGSPYIQSNVSFVPKVIETLLEIDLYKHNNCHFFFSGSIDGKLDEFVQQECEKVVSFATIAQPELEEETPVSDWRNLEAQIAKLMKRYPVLEELDVDSLIATVTYIIDQIEFDDVIVSYLDILSESKWADKLMINHGAILFMVAMARSLNWNEQELKQLVSLGLLKDLGYARLNDEVADFDIMHPLVGYEMLTEAKSTSSAQTILTQKLLNAVLVHHEFKDGSGPLARMRHPLVCKVLADEMPQIAQISGLCDLYLGLLEHYSAGIAFAVTCGFVLGQGDLEPRYDTEIIHAFIATFEAGSYLSATISEPEANDITASVLAAFKDQTLKRNVSEIVRTKSDSHYGRITLALNIVRNIAKVQPAQMCEGALISALRLPLEFGITY